MNENYFKVKAFPCDEKGKITSTIPLPFEFEINSSLVQGINDGEVILKDGKVLNQNGIFYTDLKLAEN